MPSTLFVAIPAYTGISSLTYQALQDLHKLKEAGILADFRVANVGGCPWLDVARAELVGSFWASSATHLLFVDSDISFRPRVVRDLLAVGQPAVSAIYREKVSPHTWTCFLPGGETDLAKAKRRTYGEHDVLVLERAGLGCTLLRRDALDAMRQVYAELEYTSHVTGLPCCALFRSHLERDKDGVMRQWPEDAAFWKRMNAMVNIPPLECLALIDAEIIHAGIRSNLATALSAAPTGEKS